MSLCECPRCKASMEKGQIEYARGIAAWTPAGKRKPALFPVIMGNSVIICNPSTGPTFGSEIQASLCRKCKLLVIDVSEFIE